MGNPAMVGGYWFGFVDPWPVGWYYTDAFYIDLRRLAALVGGCAATPLTETEFRLTACSRSSAATRHYPARPWAARSAVIANRMRLVF
jgi:hypothetical protein